MFSTVLVANRGEIALRVMRACRELGLRTVAVYSEADRDALHVQYADEAYLIGPPPAADSYLKIAAILDAARRSGAGSVHPGYGFLAENATFARACRDTGLVFIGPSPEAMRRMGDKVQSRREAEAARVPVVPGTSEPATSSEEVRRLAAHYGYPIAIKAVAGGGGRGLRVASSEDEIESAFITARREALAYFANEDVYVEKYLDDPRHIEVQILADTHGTILHLGERDCSIQRRHQKLVEETPSPALGPEQREEIGAAAVRLARQVGYSGVGTLEFLWQEGRFFFLEMNTRIQVEHTVTEEVTGIDLVRWQIAVARGERLPWSQDQVALHGHAIECRVNAEDPADNFRPSIGTLATYHEPGGFGVRVDSGFRAGMAIPPHYDSLIAKLITWGQDRDEAIRRMRRALDDFKISGVRTTLPFHRLVMAHPRFVSGEATVRLLERHIPAEALEALRINQPGESPVEAGRLADARAFEVEVNGRLFTVRVAEVGASATNGRSGRPADPRRSAQRASRSAGTAPGVRAPMSGTIVAVKVSPGEEVAAGQVLVVIESMKMENDVVAPRDGTIGAVSVAAGAAVQSGETLVTFKT